MEPETTNNAAVENEIVDLLAGTLPTKEEGGEPPAEPSKDSPPTPSGEAPPAEPPSPEAPSETKPAEGKEQPPGEEPPKPPADTSATPPPLEGQTEPPTTEEGWKAQVEMLQKQLVELTAKMQPQAPAPPAEEPSTAQGVIEFFKTEEEVDKAFGSAQEVNKFMTSLVNKAVEQTMRVIPQVVVNTARQQASLVNAVEKFCDVGRDLRTFRPFVGYVAAELQTAHPDWDAPKLFEEIEKEVRKRLNLKRPEPHTGSLPGLGNLPNAPRAPQGGGTGPAFVGQHSRARGTVGGTGLSATEQEILDLIK